MVHYWLNSSEYFPALKKIKAMLLQESTEINGIAKLSNSTLNSEVFLETFDKIVKF